MRISRIIGGLLLLVVILGAWQYFTAPLFWQRYLAMFTSEGEGAESEVFDYTVTVPAARQALPLPISEPPSIAPIALQAMVDYAASFNSYALLVLHRGEIQLAWYREGFDRESLTQSQSMHKTLQALLVGIAIDQGLIDSIDEPIGKYLPALRGDGRGAARLRDYLAMGSGLRPFGGGFSPFGEAFRWLYAADINAATLAIPQVETPGQRFDYHDAATQTLGMLLTEVFGQAYQHYLYEKLWNPLGAGPARLWLDNEGGNPHHNCCLLARAEDWARVGLLLAKSGEFNGQRIVSAAWIDKMRQPQLSPHYGLQTWLGNNAKPNPRSNGGYTRSEAWLAEDLFFLSGYGAQRVYVSPSRELVIVRLGPAAGYFPDIIERWDNAFLFNTAVRGILPGASGSKD